MKRRLFTIVAFLSCLLAIGVVASWVRSYRVYDQILCGSEVERYPCAWRAYDVSFKFSAWPPGIPKGASSSILTSVGKILFQHAVYSREPLSGISPHGYHWSSDGNVIPSFSFIYAVTGDQSRSGHWTVWQLTVRHWALVLLLTILPVAWLLVARGRVVARGPRLLNDCG